MNWVINQGWALYWGTSEWSAEQLQEVRGRAAAAAAATLRLS
jgi:aryl-alcohol dehydrogenase-like predicted oxidoreductase